ncbi:MAG TPA: methyltransferase domain-containing protein [Anaerolineae bacterium]|nr:methyltransferase domain-containing protein [Anaerolineae bacterium]
MPGWLWLLAVAGVILAAVAIYWLLVVTEGAYLGSATVTALYDRVARRYDGIKQFDDEDEAYFLGRPVARFLAGLPATSADPPWLLDVASGTGRLPLTVLCASEGGCRVVALDRSSAMLAEARRKLDEQGWVDVVYLAHDAARLPFAGGQFPVVTCLEALEFMPQPAAVLAELLRVTQPGGLLLLTSRIGREARLLPGRTFSRERLSATLRSLGATGVEIVSWQMDYDLVFAVKQGQAAPADAGGWMRKLQCPCCGAQPVPDADAGQDILDCPTCAWRLELSDGLWR